MAAAGEPDLERLWEELRVAISGSGALVVRDFPVDSDVPLLALTMGLGTPSAVGNGDGIIHEVKPRPPGEQRDVSSTREEFELHTDSTVLVEPHDLVCLACSHSDADAGGESLVLHVDAVVAALEESEGGAHLPALEQPVFPFPKNDPAAGVGIQEVPVLRPTPAGHEVRYRADTLSKGIAARPDALSSEHLRALAALDAVLADRSRQASYLLRPGDVLIVDNRRALHGRTRIRPGAARRLRRLKLYAG